MNSIKNKQRTLVGCVGFFALVVIITAWLYAPSLAVNPILLTILACSSAILISWTIFLYWSAIHMALQTIKHAKVVIPILALITVTALSVCFTLTSSEANISVANFLSQPGVIFIVGIAMVTIIGFLVTVSKLDDIHGRILDYPHLMERCEELAKQEDERVRKGKPGRIIIFANAPAFGHVSAPSGFARYKQYLEPLLTRREVDVEIVCLSWIPNEKGVYRLDEFYKNHWPDDSNLDAKIKESKNILNTVGSIARRDDESSQKKKLYRLKDYVNEIPFHLFMTSERAILFTALSYPQPKSPSTGNASTNEAEGVSPTKKVQIIGFETGDKGILRALEEGVKARLGALAVQESQYPSEIEKSQTPVMEATSSEEDEVGNEQSLSDGEESNDHS